MHVTERKYSSAELPESVILWNLGINAFATLLVNKASCIATCWPFAFYSKHFQNTFTKIIISERHS